MTFAVVLAIGAISIREGPFFIYLAFHARASHAASPSPWRQVAQIMSRRNMNGALVGSQSAIQRV